MATTEPVKRTEQTVATADEPTIGKLVSDTSRHLSTLVNQEIQLAKSELKLSMKYGGTGLGLFAGAAVFGLLAIIMLSVAFAYLIHWNGDGLALQWAYLIVFAVYLLIAGILAMIGLKKVKQVKGPERAVAQAKKTSETLKNRG
ncbi:phage holin family protein [Nocardioides rotundus]|uniref:phage holin family protein n=1 Tax=Nocardioides rotundus TaxID=1774216 RepID=UPI001CBBA8B7|nr:phage holin family protein [Nocardioides rotundus]UAL29483.1 phage holin family protein [Nocardioides rotundus]